MIKIILEETTTERDTYGNVYRVVKVTNVRNNKFFVTSAPSISNVSHILREAINLDWNNVYTCTSSTGSKRLSSLPNALRLDCCHYSKDWKKELNKIGFKCNKVVK